MGKILSKQISGAVDLNSDQIIEGKKTFSAPIICQKKESSHFMVSVNGFIYWVTDPNRLNQQGNFRMGVVDSSLSYQKYIDGKWLNIKG
jgi:hypothetical protein